MKRRRKCLYPNCNHSDLIKKCSCHMFPKCKAVTQKWLNLCGITSLTPRRITPKNCICSCHFDGNAPSKEDQFPIEYIEEFDDQEMDMTCDDSQSDDLFSVSGKRPKCEDDASSHRRGAAEVLFTSANESPKRVKYTPKRIFWRMRAACVRAVKKVKSKDLPEHAEDAVNTTITPMSRHGPVITRKLSSLSADIKARETEKPEALVRVSSKLSSNSGVNAKCFCSDSLSSIGSTAEIVEELVPNDSENLEEWEAVVHDASDQIWKMKIVSLKDKKERKKDFQEEKESPFELLFVLQCVANQKFSLCEALLSIDARSIFKELYEKLPDNFLMKQPTFSNAMCKLLHIVIDPLYRKEYSIGPQIKGRPVPPLEIVLKVPMVNEFEDLKQNPIQMCQALSPYMCIYTVLLGKLVEICKSALSKTLLQIQLYDTSILPVADLLKCLTSLSYDVLAYCVVKCLNQKYKDEDRNHDGFSVSMWLQSLSPFCGSTSKIYSVELSGLLQYVAIQLKAQGSLNLIILKEIVVKMAGIEAAEEMTAEQLDAMAGGELLKGEATYFSQSMNCKKSSMRSIEALADQNLTVELGLSVAQQRNCVVYHETEISHLKFVKHLYDQAQDTLVESGNFLGMNMSVEECVTRLPPIDSLLSTYKLKTDEAFFLARPMFNHAITTRYDILCESDPNVKKLSVVQKQQKYEEAAAEVMGPIVESIKPLHPTEMWENVSPHFFVTFWSLTLYDVYIPVDTYQRQTIKLKVMAHQAVDSRDRSSSKSEKEQERYLLALAGKLQDEKKKQQEHVDRVHARLCHEKENWFLSWSASNCTKFLTLYLFPRCILTIDDALYCAKFVNTIHSLRITNLSTIFCYDRLFCDIMYPMISYTENEANRYGLFLNSMLENVMRWHSDKNVFEKECASHPGFRTKLRRNEYDSDSEYEAQVEYEDFRHVCHKWQYLITKSIKLCLDSKDYEKTRNSLIILRNILPHFPVIVKLSSVIQNILKKLCEEEKNQHQDLFDMAKSYLEALKCRPAIPESSFHHVADMQVHQGLSNKKSSGGATSLTPQPILTSEPGKSAGKESIEDCSSRSKKEAADISDKKKLRKRGEIK